MCQTYIIIDIMTTIIKETTKKLGKKIKIERVRKELSQEVLAFNANISTSMMSSIERGIQSPTVEKVAAIAKALDIELYKLFIFEE